MNEADIYRETLEQIAAQKHNSLSRRLASTAIARVDATRAQAMQKWEKPLKVFLLEEAGKHKVSIQAIRHRIARNKARFYPNLAVRKINQRLFYVDTRSV